MPSVVTVTESAWKRKWLAVLLAVFLGPWTFLYTFRKDSVKAVVTLGPILFLLAITIFIGCTERQINLSTPPGQTADAGYATIGGIMVLLLVSFIAWVYAIIMASVRRKEWYDMAGASGGDNSA